MPSSTLTRKASMVVGAFVVRINRTNQRTTSELSLQETPYLVENTVTIWRQNMNQGKNCIFVYSIYHRHIFFRYSHCVFRTLCYHRPAGVSANKTSTHLVHHMTKSVYFLVAVWLLLYFDPIGAVAGLLLSDR